MAAANPGIMPGTQTDPLAQLRDIHLPAPIEVWPPAFGWWLLMLLILVTLILTLRWLWSRWQGNRYRREARSQLDAILLSWETHGDTTRYIQAYQLLLKRTALTHYERELVASLTGEAWVAFLDSSSHSTEFTMGEGQALIDGHYVNHAAAPVATNVYKLHQLGHDWIRDHGDLPAPGVAP